MHKTIWIEMCRKRPENSTILIKKTPALSLLKFSRPPSERVANTAINYNKRTNWIYISSKYSNVSAAEFIATSGERNKCLPYSLFFSLFRFHSLGHLFAFSRFRIQTEWSLTILICLLMDVRKITKIYTKKKQLFSSSMSGWTRKSNITPHTLNFSRTPHRSFFHSLKNQLQ